MATKEDLMKVLSQFKYPGQAPQNSWMKEADVRAAIEFLCEEIDNLRRAVGEDPPRNFE
jgi:hypothetical protein